MNRVDVIIVNYHTKELTLQAVRSVLDEPELNRVIVVDNASGPMDATYLKAECSDLPATVLLLEENKGFGGGNNRGIQEAEAPFVFFLNSDATIRPGCLGLLLNVLKDSPETGLVAPAIYLEDGVTLQSDSQGNFPTVASTLLQTGGKPVISLDPDWISGVAFMARREEFLQLGGFDEASFFMYMEDVDLCRRYRERGLGVARLLEAKVVHLGGKSRQSSYRQKKSYLESLKTYLALSGASLPGLLMVGFLAKLYLLFGKRFLWK